MKVTKEENSKQWKELCNYVKSDILLYNDKQLFPKILALRLKGLACGVEYAKKGLEQIYTYDFLLKVFKYLKPIILEIVERTTIKNEQHLCNLIMKIVQDNFNDIVKRFNQELKRKKEMEKANMTEIMTTEKVNYVKKENKKVKSNW